MSRLTTVTGGRSHRFSHELWLERKKKRMRWPAWRVWHAWQVRGNWALTRNQQRVQWTTTMARERHQRRGAACPGGVSPALQVDLTEFHEPHHAAQSVVVHPIAVLKSVAGLPGGVIGLLVAAAQHISPDPTQENVAPVALGDVDSSAVACTCSD